MLPSHDREDEITKRAEDLEAPSKVRNSRLATRLGRIGLRLLTFMRNERGPKKLGKKPGKQGGGDCR